MDAVWRIAGRIGVEMSMAAILALALAACSAPYAQLGNTTIRFPTGSNEPSADSSQQIADVLAPLAGNPLVEVALTAYFPYGDSSSSPAYSLAQSRIDRLKNRSAEAGMSLDLVGTNVSAIGWTYQGGEYQAVPYPPDQLDRIDMTYRVKTECHPLVDLARRLDPYRHQ
ncbi:MAG: hypothetical protein Q8S03_14595 [Brevundimonas sp.]|uniref:hypothetical protein n=1 Tax=Brevundimonas sp. TaxID=1871086 RepID=UPI0027347AB0|nr:hypothetical protein [Brevundimonas sp.]MDP3405919.1 hypothetical protein [Brevundimonas sp.]